MAGKKRFIREKVEKLCRYGKRRDSAFEDEQTGGIERGMERGRDLKNTEAFPGAVVV